MIFPNFILFVLYLQKKINMKKTAIIIMLTALTTAGMLVLQSPGSFAGSEKSMAANAGSTLPDSVQKFVQRACMDCHSDHGNGMARGKVNFSTWEGYDTEKQAKKANSISQELVKGGMPPKKWRSNNTDKVPTQAEIDMISRWAKSLQK